MEENQALRDHVVNLLEGKMAHMPFSEAVANFPMDKINEKAPQVVYTFWHLVEHLRRTQADILDFMINPDYKELEWPKDYWPDPNRKATKKDWQKSVEQFEKDLQAIITLIKDDKNNLYTAIKWGDGQTFLREAQLVADHNAYHIGELGILRQICKAW